MTPPPPPLPHPFFLFLNKPLSQILIRTVLKIKIEIYIKYKIKNRDRTHYFSSLFVIKSYRINNRLRIEIDAIVILKNLNISSYNNKLQMEQPLKADIVCIFSSQLYKKSHHTHVFSISIYTFTHAHYSKYQTSCISLLI